MAKNKTIINCTMEYNDKHQFLLIENGLVLQEFFNCPSIRKRFPKLSIKFPQKYEITIKHKGEAELRSM